jgi:hypothetical protein
MTIRYTEGNEHNPMDRSGRVELDLDCDGGLRVRHHAWLTGQTRTWSVRVEPTVTRDILAALSEARFPAQPDVASPPDARQRVLHVPGTGTVIVPHDVAPTTSGYTQAFELIDALLVHVMAQSPDGTADRGPPREPLP